MIVNNNARLAQVKSALLAYIGKNSLQVGDKLPSEGDLAKILGVSRNTLRETYITLEAEGVIIRRHGIGTFVAQPPMIKDSLNAFASFARIIEQAGYTPHFKILQMTETTAPPNVYATFRVADTPPIFSIERLVFADQHPAIYLNDYFSPDIHAPKLNWDEFDGGNVVQFLAETLPSPPHQLHSHIKAVALSGDAARMLQMPENIPALKAQSIIYDMHNEPITFSNIWFNPTIVEFNTVRIIRPGSNKLRQTPVF